MSRLLRTTESLFLILLIVLFSTSGFAERFYTDDPLWKDNDQKPAPLPKRREASATYDLLHSTFIIPKKNKKNPPKHAVNINTLGAVPDSSWFTNRIGIRQMTLDVLSRGANRLNGPDLSGTCTIIQAKSQGVSPGFTIQDTSGEIYFLKFDPRKNNQLATSAEVVVTKFFYAFGYNVPENYIAILRPEQLEISPATMITDENGQKRKMKEEDTKVILRKVPYKPGGTLQAIASRLIPGELLGPFRYNGTRSDDANDVFPHEDRRELRGMRVFAAWLNHDEATDINSMDAYQGTEENGYVKHYLIDFGSALGSASIRPQDRQSGNEYVIEWGPIFRSAASFGLLDRPWRSVKYPEYPSVGRFESTYFQPADWKPEYPNPAFDRMLPEDAFWATRIVMQFTDEMIRTLVKTGQYENPGAEDYFVQTLIERRDKVISYYLSLLPPLDEFQWTGNNLQFKNYGVDRGIGKIDGYRYQWFRFDNNTGTASPAGEEATVSSSLIPVPAIEGEYLLVRIEPLAASIPGWNRKVEVYLRGSDRSVIGIERE